MLQAELKRTYFDKQTNGEFKLLGTDYEVRSLELPWKDNKNRVSCIPEGTYTCLPDTTGKYQWFKVTNVPNRKAIEIHQGSFVRNFLGCIGLGLKAMDLDGDGIDDIRHCKPALNKLKELAPEGFELKIYS